uniref:Uncharacterized protein n=1 Tax=Atrato Sobemo-like virus 4 TaxID=2689350 RepID=A0A6B9KGL6_9VIRU|nr:hypothetical protein [Atrato Sobemo-like virus 4]
MVVLTKVIPQVEAAEGKPLALASALAAELAKASSRMVLRLVKSVAVCETEYFTQAGESVVIRRPNWRRLSTVVGAVGVACSAYRLYKNATGNQVPRFNLVMDPLKCSPESSIPGSTLFDSSPERLPSCQVRLAIKRGENEFVVIGGGVRIDNYLVTPAHNLHPLGDLYIITTAGKQVKLEGKIWDIAPDVSAVELANWSDLGVAKARLTPLARTSTATVMSSCDCKFSTGTVKPMPEIMGRMKYEATTAPGFSGSAYMSGNLCLGMHVHGGAFNGGYQILYLYCRLKHIIHSQTEVRLLDVGLVPERRRFEKKPSDGVPSEGSDAMAEDEDILEYELVGTSQSGKAMAVARAGAGRFIYAKVETFERLKELRQRQEASGLQNWADIVEEDDLRRNVEEDLYAECLVGPQGARFPGEGQPPAARDGPGKVTSQSRQVSDSSKGAQQQQLTKRDKLMKGLAQVSTAQLDLFLKSHASGKRLKQVTASPTQVQEPNGSPS